SELRRVGQCAKELLRELVLESARSARRKLRLERGERTAGHVDGAARTRLVHGHGRRAEARYARAVAERAVERLAPGYRARLGRVVRASLQVPLDRHVQVNACVAREQVEH